MIRLRFAGLLCAALAVWSGHAQSEGIAPPQGCEGIYKLSFTASIPRDQLKEAKSALPCLIHITREQSRAVSTPKDADRLLTTIRAMRLVVDENKPGSITDFREKDDIGVISVLSYAARSDNADTRVNATLILGNVTDNTTVCVPLDHLYDKQISVNGRANLLAVVLMVTEFAWPQTLDNIDTLVQEFSELPAELTDTRRIVDSLKDRAAKRRTELAGASSWNSLLAPCSRYEKRWGGDKIRYRPPPG